MMLSLPKENKKMYSDLKRDIMRITQCGCLHVLCLNVSVKYKINLFARPWNEIVNELISTYAW